MPDVETEGSGPLCCGPNGSRSDREVCRKIYVTYGGAGVFRSGMFEEQDI